METSLATDSLDGLQHQDDSILGGRELQDAGNRDDQLPAHGQAGRDGFTA